MFPVNNEQIYNIIPDHANATNVELVIIAGLEFQREYITHSSTLISHPVPGSVTTRAATPPNSKSRSRRAALLRFRH